MEEISIDTSGIRPTCPFCKYPFASCDELIDHLLLTRYNPYSAIISPPNKPATPAIVVRTENVSDEDSTQVPNISNARLTHPGLGSTSTPILGNSGVRNAASIHAEILSFEEIKMEMKSE